MYINIYNNTVPNASPEMTEGCYSWTPRQCASATYGSGTKRKVTVYWKVRTYFILNCYLSIEYICILHLTNVITVLYVILKRRQS